MSVLRFIQQGREKSAAGFVKDSPLLSGEDGLVQGPSELQVGLRCQKMGQRDLVAGRRGEALLGSGRWLFL